MSYHDQILTEAWGHDVKFKDCLRHTSYYIYKDVYHTITLREIEGRRIMNISLILRILLDLPLFPHEKNINMTILKPLHYQIQIQMYQGAHPQTRNNVSCQKLRLDDGCGGVFKMWQLKLEAQTKEPKRILRIHHHCKNLIDVLCHPLHVVLFSKIQQGISLSFLLPPPKERRETHHLMASTWMFVCLFYHQHKLSILE